MNANLITSNLYTVILFCHPRKCILRTTSSTNHSTSQISFYGQILLKECRINLTLTFNISIILGCHLRERYWLWKNDVIWVSNYFFLINFIFCWCRFFRTIECFSLKWIIFRLGLWISSILCLLYRDSPFTFPLRNSDDYHAIYNPADGMRWRIGNKLEGGCSILQSIKGHVNNLL